jgi:hypothetical protein
MFTLMLCAAFDATGISSSARCWKNKGTSMPSALAVLRLTTSSNFVGCSTGTLQNFMHKKSAPTKQAGPSAPYVIRPPTSAKERESEAQPCRDVKVGRANSTRSTGVQGFAAISDMNKSAKVVLESNGRPLLDNRVAITATLVCLGELYLNKYIAMTARPRYGRDHSPINR